MKARVKAIFTFDIYVNGVYSNEASYIKGNAMTFKQAIAEAKNCVRNFSANHVQIFLTAGSLAVADVTMFNREITVNDYIPTSTPAETYAVCWGDEYKEEDGDNNVIAKATNESVAREIALNESRDNGCAVSVVRMSDKTPVLVISDSIGLTSEAAAAYDALCSSFVDTYQPEPTNPDNTPSTMNANENNARKKSINGIMNQANRLMSVCNGARNFNRADAIRGIAFRYYDNIRACVGRFNYDDDNEYNKEYSRAQYMNA